MGILDYMNSDPAKTSSRADTPTPSTPPTPAPEGTEPLADSASREVEQQEQREERREAPPKVQPPVQQTCDRCWQTPETWVESACDYNDRVRGICGVSGKFIGYRLHEWTKKPKKRK